MAGNEPERSKAPDASIARLIARELGVAETQVAAAIDLIGEGASVPLIGRYR